MNAVIEWIIIAVALILWGIFATFLVLLNYVKDEEKKIEERRGKTRR